MAGIEFEDDSLLSLVDRSDCLVAVSNKLDIHVFFNPF